MNSQLSLEEKKKKPWELTERLTSIIITVYQLWYFCPREGNNHWWGTAGKPALSSCHCTLSEAIPSNKGNHTSPLLCGNYFYTYTTFSKLSHYMKSKFEFFFCLCVKVVLICMIKLKRVLQNVSKVSFLICIMLHICEMPRALSEQCAKTIPWEYSLSGNEIVSLKGK